MTKSEKLHYKKLYEEVTSRDGWITSGLNVQYKVVNRVLYFQCTNGEEDWKHNFDFWARPYKQMREVFYVHKGFRDLWKSVKDEIALLDFDTIVGYSQGGAIATLAHEDFWFRNGYQLKTVVFGCPRVVWFPSGRILMRFSEIVYIKNAGDIVTHVPPFLWGFRRVYGKKITLRGKAKRPKSVKLLVWISNHCPEMYKARLSA